MKIQTWVSYTFFTVTLALVLGILCFFTMYYCMLWSEYLLKIHFNHNIIRTKPCFFPRHFYIRIDNILTLLLVTKHGSLGLVKIHMNIHTSNKIICMCFGKVISSNMQADEGLIWVIQTSKMWIGWQNCIMKTALNFQRSNKWTLIMIRTSADELFVSKNSFLSTH